MDAVRSLGCSHYPVAVVYIRSAAYVVDIFIKNPGIGYRIPRIHQPLIVNSVGACRVRRVYICMQNDQRLSGLRGRGHCQNYH